MEIAREHQYLEDWSDWELISVPMLDTAFDRSEKQAIRAGVIVGQPRIMCIVAPLPRRNGDRK